MEHTENHEKHHITPLSVYIKVAGALFFLTFLTIGIHSIRAYLAGTAPFFAFGIAAIKAYLVMAYFMHLKYEVVMNRVIFGLGFIFLALLFAITYLDIWSRVALTSPL
ncbi:MAG: cytochrome C oxidase subunit IV family protein [Moraxellaceae bacterium]|nr:cytochrome C oxidase subunit IV family protein [Pseudobdellovibrionaceae bacterium]